MTKQNLHHCATSLLRMKPIDAVDGKQLHSLEASFELVQPLFPTYCSLQTNAFGLDIIAFSLTAVLSITQSLPQSPSGRFSTFTAS